MCVVAILREESTPIELNKLHFFSVVTVRQTCIH